MSPSLTILQFSLIIKKLFSWYILFLLQTYSWILLHVIILKRVVLARDPICNWVNQCTVTVRLFTHGHARKNHLPWSWQTHQNFAKKKGRVPIQYTSKMKCVRMEMWLYTKLCGRIIIYIYDKTSHFKCD